MTFEEWLKTASGRSCLSRPVPEGPYLQNRLWWAFQAGLEEGYKPVGLPGSTNETTGDA